MTNLQKLTALVCEKKEIKEDIMELRFGTIVWWYISDIWYDPNGWNWSWYWWDTYYRKMIYVSEDYCIPLDKELFFRFEVPDWEDENWYEKYKEVEVEAWYYKWIEDEDWNYCLELQDDDIKEIIWNPIEYHHLMMYCNYNNSTNNMFIECNWNVWFWACIITKFNTTLPLHKQSEEVLWALLEYLSNIK